MTCIQGYYGQGTFIAAQAPMKNTIEDTWNVIRQQNCSVVVVLTNFEEQSQVRNTKSAYTHRHTENIILSIKNAFYMYSHTSMLNTFQYSIIITG